MSDEVIHRLQERQASQKFYYDQHTHVLPSLTPGERVTVQNPRTLEWKPAVITNKPERAQRSYNVSTEHGKELRGNRSKIRQIPQKPSKHVSFDMRNNQSHQFTPADKEHVMAKNSPCQTKHGNSPLLDSEQASSLTPGTTGSHYVTRSGRVVKPPSKMNI